MRESGKDVRANEHIPPDSLIEWVKSEESRSRLKEIAGRLASNGILWGRETPPGSRHKTLKGTSENLVENLLKLLFMSHIRLGERLSRFDPALGVPWDTGMLLPSLPTLGADADTYSELFGRDKAKFRALAGSFSGWREFCEETFQCACGVGLKLKNITVRLLVHTLLKSDVGGLHITSLVGVRSDNRAHLDNHYSFSRNSRVDGRTRVISSVEARVRFDRPPVTEGAILSESSAKEFAGSLFVAAVESIVSEFEKSGL